MKPKIIILVVIIVVAIAAAAILFRSSRPKSEAPAEGQVSKPIVENLQTNLNTTNVVTTTNDVNERANQPVKVAPPEVALKILPVKVTPRPKSGKKGGAIQIENMGMFPVDLMLVIHRGSETNELVTVINAGKIRDIDEEVGWAFLSGDEIEIKSGGYQTTKVIFP